MIRVLVIEDEPVVRDVLRRMLSGKGYEVQAAGECIRPGSAAACALGCCSGEFEPDLVVVEIVAPRACSGIDAALKARERWPRVKVLLNSGSATSDWPADAAELMRRLPERCYAFLAKPFTAQQFRTAVEALLGRAPRGGSLTGLIWHLGLCGF